MLSHSWLHPYWKIEPYTVSHIVIAKTNLHIVHCMHGFTQSTAGIYAFQLLGCNFMFIHKSLLASLQGCNNIYLELMHEMGKLVFCKELGCQMS